ncbi:MAG: hypothetical protein CMP48_19180 [Rickettsiales bacterium]|nr:hypothetical protein [Rickettsiales bacterium]
MKKLILLSSLIFTLLGCSDDQTEPIKPFEGVQLRDINAEPIGIYGIDWETDWQADTQLSNRELGLLNFNDNLSLEGTSIGSLNSIVGYPNPTRDVFKIELRSNTIVKFKVVVVNENFEVLDQLSSVGNSLALNLNTLDSQRRVFSAGILQGFGGFNFSDSDLYPDKSIVRAYYSVSAEGHPNFATGFGDILICKSSLQECGVEI